MDDDLDGYWDDEPPKDLVVTTVSAQELAKNAAVQEARQAKTIVEWEEQQKAETKRDREERLKLAAEALDAHERKKGAKVLHKIVARAMAGDKPRLGPRNMPGELDDTEKKIAEVWARDLSIPDHKVATIVSEELGIDVHRRKVMYAQSKRVFNEFLIGIVRQTNEAKALRVISLYLDAGLDETKRRERKIQHSVIMESVKMATGGGAMGRPKKRLAFTMEEY